MHTVVETPEFVAAAKRAGMTEEERFDAIDFIAEHPQSGEIIEGSGGARKVRIPKKGGGKSGGYRVITYYTSTHSPVLLITVISKGKQANLTANQKKHVKQTSKSEKKRRRN